MVGITKLNGISYEYEYKISNSSGELSVADSAVQNLVYEESLFDPFPDGAIDISNPDNVLEKDFVYRGDGSDKIEILLKQKEGSGGEEIRGTFTIIGEKDYIDDSTPIKNRKIYMFMDSDEAMLLRKFPYGKAYSGKLGDILKNILEKEFDFQIDQEFFEAGDFSISGVNPFVPSINYRYLDVIYYLLQYYYYKDGEDPIKGILSKGRSGTYSLKTISKDFFAKNNDLVKEVFTTGGVIGPGGLKTNQNNPITPGSAMYNEYTNNVTSISFDSFTVDESNNFFMNSNVISYDDILGTSHIDEVRIKDVRTAWEKKFVEPFKLVGGKPLKHMPMLKEKLEGEFKTYRLPYSREQNLNIVKSNMINDFIFRNNQITLTVNGDIKRQPGTFIDVVKQRDEKSKGDSKILGRWFVTGVEHIKMGATYRNTIKAVKTFAGPTYPEKDD
jgi:hypothetical protein